MAGPIGRAHALERLRWDRLKSRFSFAQASGWLRAGKRWEFCGCHDRFLRVADPAAGFRRRALFWKVDAGLNRPNMIDFLAANIAASGLNMSPIIPQRVTGQISTTCLRD